MENNERQQEREGFFKYMGQYLRERFNLQEDMAQRDEVVESISKGVEFRGVNLWILIFATIIASLGLNVNSTAVIIGAMLISPLMGPIMGIGLSLGINDSELLKRSMRNFSLMTVTAITASTLYFFCSPLGNAQSELLARTVPTTYDVLIAFTGGLAGIVVQSRRDRISNVIAGVAIATALMPPLCTAGFGLATGELKYFVGAFYLFFINTVFIALATYLIVRFLKYPRKVYLDPSREKRVKRIILAVTLLTFIPSVVMGFHMVRVSVFEAMASRYTSQVFDFENTRVIECRRYYHRTGSRIELLLVGEPLPESVIENARAQLSAYGLRKTELLVRQATQDDRIDLSSLQTSYAQLLDEKNRQIAELRTSLARYRVENIEMDDIAREAGVIAPRLGAISLSKSISYDTRGAALDTTLLCIVRPNTTGTVPDTSKLARWLAVRTGVNDVRLFVEPEAPKPATKR